jgi:hypothetical protein
MAAIAVTTKTTLMDIIATVTAIAVIGGLFMFVQINTMASMAKDFLMLAF